MHLTHWLADLKAHSVRPRNRRSKRHKQESFVSALEKLEDRQLLTAASLAVPTADISDPSLYTTTDNITAGEVDLYRFEAAVGSTLIAETTASGQLMDTYLRLFDDQGVELARNDDGGNGLYSRIQHEFTESGIFFVGVSGYGNSFYDPTDPATYQTFGSTGGYQITIEVDASQSTGDPTQSADTNDEATSTETTAVIYETAFDSQSVLNDPRWEVYSSKSGTGVRVTAGALKFGSDYGYGAVNEAILQLDLAGRSGVQLSFDHAKQLFGSNHALPTSFVGHAEGDGVSVSADGVTWHRVESFTTDFTDRVFDLDAIVQAADIEYTSEFRIKFQQADYWSSILATRTIDNIHVTAAGDASVDVEPLEDSPTDPPEEPPLDTEPQTDTGESTIVFESDFTSSSVLDDDRWEVYTTGTTTGPRVSSGQLLLGAGSYNTLNEAVLHLDLTGRSNVELSFDHSPLLLEGNNPLPATFEGHVEGDGVAISADGVMWHQLTNLSSAFTGRTFDLDAAISAAGIEYTADFRIKFQQSDVWFYGLAGRHIDNLLITADQSTLSNSAPEVMPIDGQSVAEGQTITFSVSATDADGDAVTLAATDLPDFVTLVDHGDGSGSITVTPDFDDATSIPSFITLIATDEHGLQASQQFTLTIENINRLPIATDDQVMIDEDSEVSIEILSNDTDPDGDALTVSLLSEPVNGTVTLAADGLLTFVPEADFVGAETFTYEVADAFGDTDTAVVTVTVAPVNDVPDAADDVATLNEDSIAWPIGVLSNDFDIDNATLTIQSAVATHGSVVITEDGLGLEYTPPADFHGTDEIVYTVTDDASAADSAVVAVAVTPVNDLPVAEDESIVIDEDANAVSIEVLLNDYDPDGDSIVISDAAARNGHVEVVGGRIEYTPDAHFFGEEEIEYTIIDGNGGTAFARVAVLVNSVNDAPVAANDSLTVAEDDVGVVAILSNDTDIEGSTLAATITAAPQSGSARLNEHGVLTYTPDSNFAGSDSVTYTVTDEHGGIDTATVQILVTGVNDAPTANIASRVITILGENSEELALEDVFTDLDEESLNYTFRERFNGRILTIETVGDRAVLTPQTGQQGVARFTLIAKDGAGRTAQIELTALVKPIDNGIRFEQSTDDGRFWLTDDGQLYDGSARIAASVKQAIMLGEKLYILRHDGAIQEHTGNFAGPWKAMEAETEQIFHQIAVNNGSLLAVGWEVAGSSSGDVFRWVDRAAVKIGSNVLYPAVRTWEVHEPSISGNSVALVNHGDQTFLLRENGRLYQLADYADQLEVAIEKIKFFQDGFAGRSSVSSIPTSTFAGILRILRPLRDGILENSISAKAFVNGAIGHLQTLEDNANNLTIEFLRMNMDRAEQAIRLAANVLSDEEIWESVSTGQNYFVTLNSLVSSHGVLFAHNSRNELVRYISEAPNWEKVSLPGSPSISASRQFIEITALAQYDGDAYVLRSGNVYRYDGSQWQLMLSKVDADYANLVAASSGLYSHDSAGQVLQYDGDALGTWTDISETYTFNWIKRDQKTGLLTGQTAQHGIEIRQTRRYTGGGWHDPVSLVSKNGRELTIIGRDNQDDYVHLEQQADELIVTINDPNAVLTTNFDGFSPDQISQFTFNIDDLDHVFFQGLGGDDIFRGEVDLAITADGGDGHDILQGGTIRNEFVDGESVHDPVEVARVQAEIEQKRRDLEEANRQLETARQKRVELAQLEVRRANEIASQKEAAAEQIRQKEAEIRAKQRAAQNQANIKIRIERTLNEGRRRQAVERATQEITQAEQRKNDRIHGIKVPRWLANASKWLSDRVKPIERAFHDAKHAILQARDRAVNSIEAEFENFVSSALEFRDRAVNSLQAELDNFRESMDDARKVGGAIEQAVTEQFKASIAEVEKAATTLEEIAAPLKAAATNAIATLSEQAEKLADGLAHIVEEIDEFLVENDPSADIADFVKAIFGVKEEREFDRSKFLKDSGYTDQQVEILTQLLWSNHGLQGAYLQTFQSYYQLARRKHFDPSVTSATNPGRFDPNTAATTAYDEALRQWFTHYGFEPDGSPKGVSIVDAQRRDAARLGIGSSGGFYLAPSDPVAGTIETDDDGNEHYVEDLEDGSISSSTGDDIDPGQLPSDIDRLPPGTLDDLLADLDEPDFDDFENGGGNDGPGNEGDGSGGNHGGINDDYSVEDDILENISGGVGYGNPEDPGQDQEQLSRDEQEKLIREIAVRDRILDSFDSGLSGTTIERHSDDENDFYSTVETTIDVAVSFGSGFGEGAAEAVEDLAATIVGFFDYENWERLGETVSQTANDFWTTDDKAQFIADFGTQAYESFEAGVNEFIEDWENATPQERAAMIGKLAGKVAAEAAVGGVAGKLIKVAAVGTTIGRKTVLSVDELLVRTDLGDRKPLGRKSTADPSNGTTLPRNLREQQAAMEVLTNPTGVGNTTTRLTLSDPTWPTSEGWIKLSQRIEPGRTVDGIDVIGAGGPIEVHYVYNEVTGAIDDIKIVTRGE